MHLSTLYCEIIDNREKKITIKSNLKQAPGFGMEIFSRRMRDTNLLIENTSVVTQLLLHLKNIKKGFLTV